MGFGGLGPDVLVTLGVMSLPVGCFVVVEPPGPVMVVVVVVVVVGIASGRVLVLW